MSIGRLDLGWGYMEICAINNVKHSVFLISIVHAYFPPSLSSQWKVNNIITLNLDKKRFRLHYFNTSRARHLETIFGTTEKKKTVSKSSVAQSMIGIVNYTSKHEIKTYTNFCSKILSPILIFFVFHFFNSKSLPTWLGT